VWQKMAMLSFFCGAARRGREAAECQAMNEPRPSSLLYQNKDKDKRSTTACRLLDTPRGNGRGTQGNDL